MRFFANLVFLVDGLCSLFHPINLYPIGCTYWLIISYNSFSLEISCKKSFPKTTVIKSSIFSVPNVRKIIAKELLTSCNLSIVIFLVFFLIEYNSLKISFKLFIHTFNSLAPRISSFLYF